MAQIQYKNILKGGVTTSIGNDGLVTKSATWMIVTEDTNVLTNWKSLGDIAEEWAGKIGDKWREPTQTGKECTSYSETDLFRVTDIQIESVNRLYYEVTFTAVQNLSVMTMIGNIDVSIDNTNQKTATATYQIDLATGAVSELESLFYTSGNNSIVIFNSGTWLIESSTYSPQSKTRYTLTVSLKDMSVMRIGNPSYNTDIYGMKTASIEWRYDKVSYSSLTLPEAGDSADIWLGLSNSGYVITGVESDPEGVLGYIVKIDAKLLADRYVKTDEEYALDTDYSTGESAIVNPTITITKQSTEDEKNKYKEMVGNEASIFGYNDYTISNVSVNDLGSGDYEVTIEITSDEYSRTGDKKQSQNYLRNQVEISINYSHIILEPQHLGYTKGISGIEWVAINNPPKTTFMYDLDIDSITEMNENWTASSVLNMAKTGKIGFSRVHTIYNQDLKPYKRSDWHLIPSGQFVGKIRLIEYNYAQPTHTQSGMSLRNVYFIPWRAKDSAIIYAKKSHRTSFPQYKGNDRPMKESWIGKKIPVIEASVSKYYRGKASSVLNKWEHRFYSDAVKELKLKDITSYKTISLNVEEVTDNKGRIWTKVSRTLSGLKGYYWNHNYNEGDFS